MKCKSVLCGGLLTIFGFAASAGATPISGTLNITGAVNVSATLIDWLPLATGEGAIATAICVSPCVPGYFSQIFNPAGAPFYDADAVDLNSATTVLPVANFLNDFNTPNARYNDLSFTLTQILIPTVPICTGAE